ncbi:hypothetical protein CPLU01_10664 [Colletotrichum plurivorum]|uniref:Uncharacterized protein n=1 Tax=Colletotrichum plurivorum TaxID=2175906 RepID=A0A8H6K4X9_9PEZI|nr:hypothetical protein CPLU01_10664 [Colletotrichum plurivorum]
MAASDIRTAHSSADEDLGITTAADTGLVNRNPGGQDDPSPVASVSGSTAEGRVKSKFPQTLEIRAETPAKEEEKQAKKDGEAVRLDWTLRHSVDGRHMFWLSYVPDRTELTLHDGPTADDPVLAISEASWPEESGLTSLVNPKDPFMYVTTFAEPEVGEATTLFRYGTCFELNIDGKTAWFQWKRTVNRKLTKAMSCRRGWKLIRKADGEDDQIVAFISRHDFDNPCPKLTFLGSRDAKILGVKGETIAIITGFWTIGALSADYRRATKFLFGAVAFGLVAFFGFHLLAYPLFNPELAFL